ncbi:MAG: fibronectin type III domain-containing protein [Halobacteriales archaeon]|nr:fibronectin type III domain-containing protein [Halobacteriales archaeon]
MIPADERDNRPDVTAGAQVTATPTQTGGNAPGAIVALTAAAGTPPAHAVQLSWLAPSAPANPGGTVSGYKVLYSTLDLNTVANQATMTQVAAANVAFSPSAFAAPLASQQATVSNLDDGTTYYFTVEAVDNTNAAGPVGGIASIRTAVDPNAITNATVRTNNLAVSVSVAPVTNGTGNVVTWTLPAADPLHAVLGVEIWRCTSSDTSSCVLVKDLPSSTADFKAGSYVDAAGDADSKYLVTAYYGSSPSKGYAHNQAEAQGIPGWSELSPTGASSGGFLGMPLWVWIVGGLVLLLLVAGGIYMAMRGRGGNVQAGEPGSEWGEAEAAPAADEWGEAAPEAEAAAPPAGEAGAEAAAAAATSAAEPEKPKKASLTHYITCPKCSTEFSATGTKPLAIQCPNCGVRGTLR